MEEQEREILLDYARDALNILEFSIRMHEAGNRGFYRVAAIQLRLLLCDTAFRHGKHENISMIPKLVPDLRLVPYIAKTPTDARVDLQTWLDGATGLKSPLSIRQLIRRICDIDGGAHVEIKPLAGLPENENTSQWVIDISKYLLPLLSSAISA
jgi:hypothetical protein